MVIIGFTNSCCRSLIDLNRAGVPLMELVFEPDLKNGEEAVALVKELMIILQRLNACSCKMEGYYLFIIYISIFFSHLETLHKLNSYYK